MSNSVIKASSRAFCFTSVNIYILAKNYYFDFLNSVFRMLLTFLTRLIHEVFVSLLTRGGMGSHGNTSWTHDNNQTHLSCFQVIITPQFSSYWKRDDLGNE